VLLNVKRLGTESWSKGKLQISKHWYENDQNHKQENAIGHYVLFQGGHILSTSLAADCLFFHEGSGI
jgi:hypothetical protein